MHFMTWNERQGDLVNQLLLQIRVLWIFYYILDKFLLLVVCLLVEDYCRNLIDLFLACGLRGSEDLVQQFQFLTLYQLKIVHIIRLLLLLLYFFCCSLSYNGVHYLRIILQQQRRKQLLLFLGSVGTLSNSFNNLDLLRLGFNYLLLF